VKKIAPIINNFDITSMSNQTGNKLVNLMTFTSKPTCEDGATCVTSFYDYLPGLLIILMVYFILFFSLKLRGYSLLATFTACNIVNLVLVLLLYPLNILSGRILIVSIVLVPLSGLFLWFEQRGG